MMWNGIMVPDQKELQRGSECKGINQDGTNGKSPINYYYYRPSPKEGLSRNSDRKIRNNEGARNFVWNKPIKPRKLQQKCYLFFPWAIKK